jgi:hypothetical protein
MLQKSFIAELRLEIEKVAEEKTIKFCSIL